MLKAISILAWLEEAAYFDSGSSPLILLDLLYLDRFLTVYLLDFLHTFTHKSSKLFILFLAVMATYAKKMLAAALKKVETNSPSRFSKRLRSHPQLSSVNGKIFILYAVCTLFGPVLKKTNLISFYFMLVCSQSEIPA